MTNFLSNWNGTIELNGERISKSHNLRTVSGPVHIMLYPEGFQPKVQYNTQTEKENTCDNKVHDVSGTYRITVKSWMTKKSTPEFDFMAHWNNDIPMPLVTMVGEKVKETRGMVYMELHGDITSRITQTCIRCGKPITNDVSKYFGMGPKCGGHNYVSPFSTEAELKAAVGEYRKKLQSITWEGWLPKSAIIEEEEL